MSEKKKHDFSIRMPVDKGEIVDWIAMSSIEFQFEAISQHIEFVRESVTQEQEKLELMASDFVESIDNCNEDEKNSLYHGFINGGSSSVNYEYSAISSFPQIQWRSEFLVLYSYFEHILNHLCHVVQKRSELELSLKDIYGQGIERARTYLVKLGNVKKPFETKYWQRAKFLSEIRNAIAHKNSEIEYKPKDLKSLYSKLEKEEYISLEISFENKDLAEVMLSHEFLKQSVIELRTVIYNLCKYELYSKKTT